MTAKEKPEQSSERDQELERLQAENAQLREMVSEMQERDALLTMITSLYTQTQVANGQIQQLRGLLAQKEDRSEGESAEDHRLAVAEQRAADMSVEVTELRQKLDELMAKNGSMAASGADLA